MYSYPYERNWLPRDQILVILMDQNLSHYVVKIFWTSDILRVKSKLNILFPLLMTKLQNYYSDRKKLSGHPHYIGFLSHVLVLDIYHIWVFTMGIKAFRLLQAVWSYSSKKVVLDNLGSALLNIKLALQWNWYQTWLSFSSLV